jgi:hypothetical protein
LSKAMREYAAEDEDDYYNEDEWNNPDLRRSGLLLLDEI